MSFLLFSLFWFGCVPPAAARVADTIAHETVFAPLRAYVEARYAGTGLDYLVGCPVCLSFWVCLLFTLLAFTLDFPVLVTDTGRLFGLVALVHCLAAWEVAIRFWIRRSE